ncbi:hypothetical protein BC835DRAFT_1030797 [Cytidiella melzeri]|nr:hypothetical protein BC835DRAFT_1030797 [Cytidiella melzeri]
MPPRRKGARKDPLAGLPSDAQNVLQELLGSRQPRSNAPIGSDAVRMLANKSPEDLERIMSALSGLGDPKVDLESFDYSKVKVKKNSFWVMQMSADGFVGPKEQFSHEYKAGYKPNFQLIIYDESSSFRVCETTGGGLPSSSFLLTAIKKSIASPMPPIRQSLPQLLIIAIKLSPHVDALRPFLDSLPAPFSWRVETPEEAAEVASGVHEKNVEGVALGLSTAQTEKALGNQAIASKNRSKAVKHYTEAIECLLDAISQNPTKEEKTKIEELLSVCHVNRSVAWMMEGSGLDPKKALKDAEDATLWNEDYAKAYYRQAKACHLLDDRARAIEILEGALGRPKLAKDKGLSDFLQELTSETSDA